MRLPVRGIVMLKISLVPRPNLLRNKVFLNKYSLGTRLARKLAF